MTREMVFEKYFGEGNDYLIFDVKKNNSDFDKNISASSKQFKTNGKSQPLGSDSFCEICIAEFINNVFKMCPA